MTRPGQQRAVVRDGLVAVWCALWVVVGLWTGYEVWQLSELTQTVAESGRALDEAGQALEGLASLPLIGDPTAELAGDVRANAAEVVRSAGQAEGTVRRLAVLLGLTIVLVPSVPVAVAHRAVRGRLLAEA